MSGQEREQNKKINEHSRQISNLQHRLKTIELDVEPRGRISSSFEVIEEDLDEIKSRITRLEQNTEHRFNRLDAKLEVIIEHLTGVNDLPEE
jgi:septal ring factor EnvC (AmiA/AmiB activator)